MQKKRTRVFGILLVLTLILSVAGCVPAQPATTSGDQSAAASGNIPTIRFAHGWSLGTETKVGAEFINQFAESNKDKFELVQEVVAGDEMKTKIKVDVAGNNVPDAWMYWGSVSDAGAFEKSGILLDIDEYLAQSEQTEKSDYSDGMWEGFVINGKTHGIPLESYVGYWMVNKDLFEEYNLEYPTTYEELLAVSKVFNENGIVPLAMGSKGGNPSHFFMSELYMQLPNALDDLRALGSDWVFDTPNTHTVLNLIDDMRQNNVFPSDTVANGDWGPSFALYNEGRAAMIYSFTWMLSSMKPEIAEASVLIPAPIVPGGTVDPATFVSSSGSYGLLINAESFHDPEKQAALVALADMVSSDEFVEALVYKAGMVPAKNITIDESRIEIPILARVLDYASGKDKMTNHWLKFPATQPWADAQNFLDEVFAGSMTPDEYIAKIQASLDEAKAEQ